MNEIRILPEVEGASNLGTTWKVVIHWAGMSIGGFETFDAAGSWVINFIAQMVRSVTSSQQGNEAAQLAALLQKVPFQKE